MIHHQLPNIHTASKADRTLDLETYYGFAVGADGVHQEYEVTIDGRTYYVGLGSLVMLESAVKGRPVVSPVRRLVHQSDSIYVPDGTAVGVTNAWQSPSHLMAFTCPRDFQAEVPKRLRTIAAELSPDSGEVVQTDYMVYQVPFAGRLSALISITGDAGDTAKIWGGCYPLGDILDQTPGESDIMETIDANGPYELLATVNGSGTVDIISQDVGAYDVLLLSHGDGAASGFSTTVQVRVI